MLTKEFFLAGQAVFTLKVPSDFIKVHGCKSHYTFKVQHKEANGTWPETWFVMLLSGPDNTSDYRLFGLLNTETGAIRLTQKTNLTDNCWPVKFARRIFARIVDGSLDAIEQAGFELLHAGRCGACGRKLTTPESIEIGLGPICAGRSSL